MRSCPASHPLAILVGKGTTATDEEIAAYGTGVLAVTADIEPGRRRALCDLAAREAILREYLQKH